MFESEVSADVLRVRRPGTRWLSTGFAGGYETADAAYNCTVTEGFARTDLSAYVAESRERADFPEAGPAMLTGVDLRHARRARLDGVEVVATAGVSNPAALPMGGERATEREDSLGEESPRPGTVNLLVGTTRALSDGALATLLATVVEAKTATLLAETGFTGTTSDAVVVGSDPSGELAAFAGSATPVGRSARVCVRDAVRASLDGRYGAAGGDRADGDGTGDAIPDSVAAAEHGTVSNGCATVSRVGE
ncbi:adenosylcobinamide amidohydrolase [Halosimplex carlsbadense 2-9-1]|uniref:Adenosylcobinamide amidohydrolase n=1 Tax=Halosimplex carlsbadense 2-9-1 TaxID=797114 RepID=M0D7C2_9EURY|nr:adenosylcobinamide amidohydrolase [Halosimplex carlsbadense]ELZ30567.1 adenosylcobinamide amidohydrolase [Halosimplex carlsbadense 2-9-1]